MNDAPVFGESRVAASYAEASKLSHAGKFQLAADGFRSLASQCDDPLEKANYLIEEAECRRRLTEYNEASRCVAEARNLVGDNAISGMQITYFEARLLVSQDKREEALDILSKILKDHPTDLENGEGRELYEQIQVQRGFALMHLERYAEASPLLEEVATFKLPADWRSDVLCHLGRCYFEFRRYADAREQLRQAKVLGINDGWSATYHYYLGYSLYELEDFAAARRELVLCLQSETHGPPQSYVYRLLAAVCRKMGDREEARMYEKLAKSI